MSQKRSTGSLYDMFLDTFHVKEELEKVEQENKEAKKVKPAKKVKKEQQIEEEEIEEFDPNQQYIYEKVENPEDEVYVPSDEDEEMIGSENENIDDDMALLENDEEDEDGVIEDDENIEEGEEENDDGIRIQNGENYDNTETSKQNHDYYDTIDVNDEKIALTERKEEALDDLDNEEDKETKEDEENLKDPFVREIYQAKFSVKQQKYIDKYDWSYSKLNFDDSTQSRYCIPSISSSNKNDTITAKNNWIKNSFIKDRLQKPLESVYKSTSNPELFNKLFSIINDYNDILYANMNDEDRDCVRNSISEHILNHILKSRDIEMRHTRKIHERALKERQRHRELEEKYRLAQESGEVIKKKKSKKNKDIIVDEDNTVDDIKKENDVMNSIQKVIKEEKKKEKSGIKEGETLLETNEEQEQEYRDQGYTRPKVLVICPFKYNAYMFVNSLVKLLPKDVTIEGIKRFKQEYEGDNDENSKQNALTKAFPGNNEDCFRFGMAFKRKTVSIFKDFYNSDMIVASPVGIRQIIGESGEKNRNFDFLSSIEILYIENADIIDYQNWSHMITICKTMNRTLRKSRETDFSRVKEYVLDGYSEYMRQTIITSRYIEPKMKSLMNLQSHNYRGKYEIRGRYEGSSQNRQLFVRLPAVNLLDINNSRMTYFKDHILPFIQKKENKGILLYVEEYLDYVSIRNLMMEEIDEEEVAVLNEYLPKSECQRSLTYFKNGIVRILLYSGRYHYFRRQNPQGVQTVFFIGLPREASFYQDIINTMPPSPLSISATTLYTNYEGNELERIVGTDRYKTMIKGKRSSFIFC
ncbi:hypothetical protein WA158_006693 [Blastocystis sp. Blastoise]